MEAPSEGTTDTVECRLGALPSTLLEMIAERVDRESRHQLRVSCRAARAAVNATTKTLSLLQHPALQLQLQGGAAISQNEVGAIRASFPNITTLVIRDHISEILGNCDHPACSFHSNLASLVNAGCSSGGCSEGGCCPSSSSRSACSSAAGDADCDCGSSNGSSSFAASRMASRSTSHSSLLSAADDEGSDETAGTAGVVAAGRGGAGAGQHNCPSSTGSTGGSCCSASKASSSSCGNKGCSRSSGGGCSSGGDGSCRSGAPKWGSGSEGSGCSSFSLTVRPRPWTRLQHVVFHFEALTGGVRRQCSCSELQSCRSKLHCGTWPGGGRVAAGQGCAGGYA